MDQQPSNLQKPSVGGMDLCRRCNHPQWEHNVDIIVDGKIARPKSDQRAPNICQHGGSVRACFAFCQGFE